MNDNKGLNDLDLLQLCRSGETITKQDIGIMSSASNADSNGLKYLSEGTMPGVNPLNFNHNGDKDDDVE